MLRTPIYIMILGIGMLLSCNKDEVVQEPPPFGILKYFGFTLIDVGWDDPTDSSAKTNYLDEVSDFTNIADILITSPTDLIMDRLDQMHDAEVAGILNIYFLLFEAVVGSAPSGNKYQLRSDYAERWKAFVDANQLQSAVDKIGTFYIGEEPTWNGISASELKAACDLVNQDFPDTPIMIIEAFPILDQLVIPQSADWIGFDQYFIEDPANDPRYQSNLQILASKMQPHQDLVVILDAHHYIAGHVDQGNLQVSDMGRVAENYYNMVSIQARTVALLGYFWPNRFDDPNAIGARGMPDSILTRYEEIGSSITGK